jgi:hypothetical protein
METFLFFIPIAVVAAMGLINDGMTVSREVRTGDLLADGTLSVNEYHALARAGVVFMPIPLFTFQSVEEAAEGWICSHLEPEPLAWGHTLALLEQLFPGGQLGTGTTTTIVVSEELFDRLPIYHEDDGDYIRCLQGLVLVDYTHVGLYVVISSNKPLEIDW